MKLINFLIVMVILVMMTQLSLIVLGCNMVSISKYFFGICNIVINGLGFITNLYTLINLLDIKITNNP